MENKMAELFICTVGTQRYAIFSLFKNRKEYPEP
jgi:hypothetical protein